MSKYSHYSVNNVAYHHKQKPNYWPSTPILFFLSFRTHDNNLQHTFAKRTIRNVFLFLLDFSIAEHLYKLTNVDKL